MAHRQDPLPMGSSADNATRDAQRQRTATIAELRRKRAAGEISAEEFMSMMSLYE
jgi:hypothetical protein